MTKKIKTDLKYKKNDTLSDDCFAPSNIKERITTMLDSDIIIELKRIAKEQNSKYQTVLNKILRDAIFEDKTLESRVKKIEKILKIKAS